MVSWNDYVLFCNKLSNRMGLTPFYKVQSENEDVALDITADGFRLPTEEEWQYACQSGTKEIRYGKLDEIAWFKGNSDNQTQQFGQKQPNKWGLYDMLGNVCEWCSELYDTYRIFRGGGWCDVERSVMSTTCRSSHPTKFKIDDLGFRIAKNK